VKRNTPTRERQCGSATKRNNPWRIKVISPYAAATLPDWWTCQMWRAILGLCRCSAGGMIATTTSM
jgi:hypothetical protein